MICNAIADLIWIWVSLVASITVGNALAAFHAVSPIIKNSIKRGDVKMKSVVICQDLFCKCAYRQNIGGNCKSETCEYSGFCEFQRPRDCRKEIEIE